YWLKMIGMTESPLTGTYEREWVDFAKNKRPRHIHPGDQLVLYACGGSKRVFALAKVTSEVHPANYMDRFPYRVDIEYELNLPVSHGVHINEISTIERDLARSLLRASYLELRPEEYEQAATKLRHALRKQ